MADVALRSTFVALSSSRRCVSSSDRRLLHHPRRVSGQFAARRDYIIGYKLALQTATSPSNGGTFDSWSVLRGKVTASTYWVSRRHQHSDVWNLAYGKSLSGFL